MRYELQTTTARLAATEYFETFEEAVAALEKLGVFVIRKGE
jgi:hypothetical protein